MINKTVSNIESHLSVQHANAAYDGCLTWLYMESDKVGSLPYKPRTSSGRSFYKSFIGVMHCSPFRMWLLIVSVRERG